MAKLRRVKEEWRDIPDYEGFYQVSNIGRVRGLNRTVEHPGKSNGQRMSGRILSLSLQGAGYFGCSLCKDGGVVKHLVHRLVLSAFIGLCPVGLEGCHNDGNPKNNILQNLRWDTHSSNLKDKRAHGTGNEGIKHWGRRLSEEDVIEIRKVYEAGGVTQTELAGIYNVSQTHISRLVRRVKWSHVK